jgi:hypothetical protein
MNLRKVAVVSGLCIVIVVCGLLIHHYYPSQQASQRPPYVSAIQISVEYIGSLSLKVELKSNLGYALQVSYRIVATWKNGSFCWASKARSLLVPAHSNETAIVKLDDPYIVDLVDFSGEILSLQYF